MSNTRSPHDTVQELECPGSGQGEPAKTMVCVRSGGKCYAVVNGECLPPVSCCTEREKNTATPTPGEGPCSGSGSPNDLRKRPRDVEDLVRTSGEQKACSGTLAPTAIEGFPELTPQLRKKLATETALILLGPFDFLIPVAPILLEAYKQAEQEAGGSSTAEATAELQQEKPQTSGSSVDISGVVAISLLVAATTDTNITKIRKGTSVYGSKPVVLVVSQREDIVCALAIDSWCPMFLEKCPRYRTAKVTEAYDFFVAVKKKTAPTARRGRPRPPEDRVQSFPHIRWAVQCSFHELVHRAKDADVFLLLWHEHCPACGEALRVLNSLFEHIDSKRKKLAKEEDPSLTSPTVVVGESSSPTSSAPKTEETQQSEGAAAPPIYAVCCNIADNQLDEEDWNHDVLQPGSVPCLRLYPAVGREGSAPVAAPVVKQDALQKVEVEYRKYVTLSGPRTVETILEFLRREVRHETSKAILQTFQAEDVPVSPTVRSVAGSNGNGTQQQQGGMNAPKCG